MSPTTHTATIIAQLDRITDSARELEERFADALAEVHPEYRAGARNLIAYLAMRHIDIRDLQAQLAQRGLSSLGRAERNVQATIRAVRNALCRLEYDEDYHIDAQCAEFDASERRLEQHIEDALGRPADGRNTSIMVTLPTEAATDAALVHDLVAGGMDIARINCARDDASVWKDAVDNIGKACADTGRGCRIVMDLAGPKLRTGDLKPGPGVIRLRPKRDAEGNVLAGRRLRFVPDNEYEPVDGSHVFPVPAGCIKNAEIGDWVQLWDMRGKRRELEVVGKDEHELVLECEKTTYIGSRTKIRLRSGNSGEETIYRIGELPGTDNPIILMKGDSLVLHRDPVAGEPAKLGKCGELEAPAHISCRQPEVFRDLEEGAPIRLNDGKIEGILDKVSPDQLVIRVTRAKRSGSRLRADKGINFPGSDIKLRGLTEADHANLPFVVEYADAVSLSFVRKPVDILSLLSALGEASGRDIGIIIKIETRKAFKDLPRLLLTAMRHYPAAVMIARGDLAVECGWERLAEIQEEILWMCEAAEMPVIWATQVLERETKSGQPSRAEITDAAMSQRADCVMLNKGPHIRDAIRMLDDILRRMQAHQHKKSPKLRRLDISDV